MKQKYISFIILLTLIISMLNGCNGNKSEIDFKTIINEDGTSTLIMIENFKGGVLKIPEKNKEGVKIAVISTYAFYSIMNDNIEITELYFPDNLIEIKRDIILNDLKIKTVHFGSKLQKVSETFFHEVNLGEIKINTDNESFYVKDNCLIEKGTNSIILGCNKSIIPTNIAAIGSFAFSGRQDFKFENLPEGIKRIGDAAFSGCISLDNVILPDGLEEIGNSAFSYTGLTNIRIPNSVIDIGMGVFAGTKLSAIPSLGSFKKLTHNMFSYCQEFFDITVPEGIETIDSGAFEFCGNLSEVNLPSTLISMSGWDVFFGCKNLEKINISEDNPVYYVQNENLIEKETEKIIVSFSLLNIPTQVNVIGESSYISNRESTNSIISIPSNVNTIESFAFIGLSFKKIYIPINVVNMGSKIFGHDKLDENSVIYCEFENKPDTWSDDWNYSDYTVIWGVTDD